MLALAAGAPLVLDANPIAAPVEWIVGSIGSYLQGIHPGTAVAEPLTFLVPLGDPGTAAARNPLAGVLPRGGDFDKIATQTKEVGYTLFAILLVARLLKLAATGRFRSPEHVLFDLAPKLLLGILAMQFFDRALSDAGRVSMEGAFLLEDALLFPLHLNAKDIVSAFPTDGLGVVLMPTLYLLVAYLVLLVVMSRLVLLLGALVSPLGIPIAIQSDHGSLAASWIRMIVSGLLVPVLAGVGAAGSLAVGWLVHQVAGNGPFLGSYLGALTAECGLFFTAFAATAMFRDAVKQGVAGARGSFQGVGMGAVGRAPGEALGAARRGVEAAVGVGIAAAGVPVGAALTARALKDGRPGPEPDAGGGAPAPEVPRLPGGPGGSGAGSRPSLPAPRVHRLPGGRGEAGAGTQLMLPEHSRADIRPGERARIVRRRSGGGQVIEDVEYQHVYAIHLSEPAGGPLPHPDLGRVQEA